MICGVTEAREDADFGASGNSAWTFLERVESLREANPMLGLRGVRLGIQLPGLTRMQVRAIFEAACALRREGVRVLPEVTYGSGLIKGRYWEYFEPQAGKRR